MANEKQINTLDTMQHLPQPVHIEPLNTKQKIYSTYPLIKQYKPSLTYHSFTILQDEMLNEGYHCVGAFIDEDIIGMCSYWIRHRFCTRRSLHIDHIIVADRMRNRGIGSALMKEMYEIAERRECFNVVLETYVDNKNAQEFYLHKGLKIAGVSFMKEIVD